MEAICFFETSVILTRATRRHITKENIVRICINNNTALCRVEDIYRNFGNLLLLSSGFELGGSASQEGEAEYKDLGGREVTSRPVSELHNAPSQLLF
jgi:hypothetical protein